MVSWKPDVSKRIILMDHMITLITMKTLGLQHVCNPVRQMRRNFSLLILAIDAFVETPCLLRMLFQILNAILFVLENQGLGENVEATTDGVFVSSHPSVCNKCQVSMLFLAPTGAQEVTLCVCPSVCRILHSIFIILDQAFKSASHLSLSSLSEAHLSSFSSNHLILKYFVLLML